MHKIITTALAITCLVLGYQVFTLKQELRTNERNTAIAVLSAEAANNKIGSVAPYFRKDDAAFAKAWADTMGMPLAVFPDEVLAELRRELQENRASPAVQAQSKQIFGVAP